jgi:hypothetical protein
MNSTCFSHKMHKTSGGIASVHRAYRRANFSLAASPSLFVFFVANPSGPSALSAPFVAISILSA